MGEADSNGRTARGTAPAITLKRTEPTEYVLLVAKLAKSGGSVVPGTDHFKPSGTEFASEADLLLAGYVPRAWIAVLLAACDPANRDAAFGALARERGAGGDVAEALRDETERVAF